MCKVILPCAVGKSHWAKHCYQAHLQKMVGKVEEAFCILVLNNYWEKWWAMVEGDDEGIKTIRTKWTDEGKGATARLNGGWSQEGRGELGRIVKLVLEDRSSRDESRREIRMAFEDALLDYYQQQESAKKSKKRKAVAEPTRIDNEEFMDDLADLLGDDRYGLSAQDNELEAEADENELMGEAQNVTPL